MTPFRDRVIGWGLKLVALVRRRRLARDLEDELAFHLAMREADLAGDRVAEPSAALAARRRFGNVTSFKEQLRDMWTFTSLEHFWRDLRYTLRTLRRSPAFTVVALLALAVGIGSTSAIFSLVDAVAFRGLPYADPNRLVVLIGNVQRTIVERRGASYPDYLDWRRAKSFVDMAAYDPLTTTLTSDGEAERIAIESVSAPYFSLLGVTPARGRTFRPDEDEVAGRHLVTVLSDGLWKRRFGSDPAIVGKTITLGPRTFEVVGVMPPGFTGLTDQAQLWIPFVLGAYPLDNRSSRGFQVVARLNPDVSIPAATAEMAAIARQLEQAYPQSNDKRAVEIAALGAFTFGPLRNALVALMGAVSFVLLIACANVANLLIARSELRQREMAVRAALGAGQGRLLGQLVTEGLVLTGLGAAAGLALAHFAVRLAVATSPVTFPSFVRPSLNLAVVAFTVGVSVVCGVLLGLAPAAHARVSRLADVLKESARGTSGRSQRMRNALVVAEVSLAVVLLIGAGLMIRTVRNLTSIDPGFTADPVLALSVGIPRQPAPPPVAGATPGTPPPAPPLVVAPAQVVERLRALPGVTSVSLASDSPLDGGGSAIFYTAEGDTTTDAQTIPRAYLHRVTPEFFATLQIPLRAGRTFEPGELTASSPAVIVSEALVRRFWPGQDPIGRRVKLGNAASPNPWLSIVGVVGETNYRALPRNPTADPDLYLPWTDRTQLAVVLRADRDPAAQIVAARAAVRSLHPALVVYNVGTMADRVRAQTAQPRFTSWLLGLFATTALMLSVVGVYGVMSYLVSQRRREFGIRLALGASGAEIVRLVLGSGARMVGLGVVIGVAAAFGLGQLAKTLFFGVTSTDSSIAMSVGVLALVAFAACYIPALRATRVDPVRALRND